MKIGVKGLLFGAAVMSLSAVGHITVAAASIDKIKIRLEVDGFDEMERPVLDAESRDDAYVVTGIEYISDDPESSYEIEVESEEGDTFSVLEQADIKFSGLHALCSKAVRKDNGEKLLLTIEVQDAEKLIGMVDGVSWDGTKIGRWKRAPGASAYLVMLYLGEKRVGHPHRTSIEQYDFSPLMKEAGVYHFKVFPLTKQGKRGKSAESSWNKVTESEAIKNKELWSGKTSGWQSKGELPAYILKDGTYPQMDALFIDDVWYKFDERGDVCF